MKNPPNMTEDDKESIERRLDRALKKSLQMKPKPHKAKKKPKKTKGS
jgi:hypothetical protein